MCGFFALSLDMTAREFSDYMGLVNLPKSIEDIQSLKFSPFDHIPTVSKNSPNQLVMRSWSLIPRWWKDDPSTIKFSTFNARMEGIDAKATFRTPWKQSQRCLIPVSWFYEFETVTVKGEKRPKKVPHRVEIPDKPVIGIAGLYEVWKDSEGREIESCTMITCDSVEPLKRIHKRQPVLIPKDDWEAWLSKDTSPEEAQNMLQPSDLLMVRKISPEFNKMSAGMLQMSDLEPVA